MPVIALVNTLRLMFICLAVLSVVHINYVDFFIYLPISLIHSSYIVNTNGLSWLFRHCSALFSYLNWYTSNRATVKYICFVIW